MSVASAATLMRLGVAVPEQAGGAWSIRFLIASFPGKTSGHRSRVMLHLESNNGTLTSSAVLSSRSPRKDGCRRLPPVNSRHSSSHTKNGLDQDALRVTTLGGSMANGLMDCSSSTSLARSSRRCRSVRPVPTFPTWTSDPQSSWAPRINEPTPPAAPPDPGTNPHKTASQLALNGVFNQSRDRLPG